MGKLEFLGALLALVAVSGEVQVDGSAGAGKTGRAQHAAPWSCSVFGCTCQGMADYYGAIAGYGFGCAPAPAMHWWSDTKHCAAKAQNESYCKGPACLLPGAAPCQQPAPGPAPRPAPPAPAPAPPSTLCASWGSDTAGCLRHYDVEWDGLWDDSQSPTWINTMPVGNGRFAANVWIDRTGTISALISAPGAWSEAGELLKVGLVRVAITPNPFTSASASASSAPTAPPAVKQTLDLATATVRFQIGPVRASVYFAAQADRMVVEVSGAAGLAVAAAVNLARANATDATPSFDCQSYTTSADVRLPTSDGVATWYVTDS